ncbi:dihydropteroate synthase [bacterium]|nr:dihydropteroate synthase [bacterium]
MNPIPARAQYAPAWRLARHRLCLSPRCLVMGVLNVTPDSFSDGGAWYDPQAAIARGRALAAEGADILDVGGESTRPGAAEVPVEEELRRVLPVVKSLAAEGFLVSIDTRKAAVAGAALAAGAAIINDVSGGNFDPQMLPLAARTRAGLVLMHMRGTPTTMRRHAVYTDVVSEVKAELCTSAARAEAAGVAREAIVLDPGIGFAKTAEQNWTLLAHLHELCKLDYPILLGTSRKSFLASLSDPPSSSAARGATTGEMHARDLPTAATLVAGRLAGAAIFRVHHAALARAVLAVADRLREAQSP